MGTSKRKDGATGTVFDLLNDETVDTKKKSLSGQGLDETTTDGSQSSSSSELTSAKPKKTNSVFDLIDDKDLATPATTTAPEPDVNGETKPAENKIVDPFSIPKKPSVVVAGMPVELDGLPVPLTTATDEYAKQLQDRIDNKIFDDRDVSTVAGSMKVSEPSAKAFMQGKSSTGTLIHFNDLKQQQKKVLDSTVEQANAELGRQDKPDDVLSNYQTAGQYLRSLETAYAQKTKSEVAENIDVSTNPYNAAQDVNIRSGINDKNNTALSKFRNIIGNDIIDKIYQDESLTKDQKVNTASSLINKRTFDNTQKAIDSRLSPVNSIIANVLGKDTEKDIDVLNSEKAGVELTLNRKIKEQLDYNAAQKGSILEDFNDRVQQVATPEEKQALQKQTQAQLDAIDLSSKNLSAQYENDEQVFKKYPVLFKQQIISDINDFNAIRSNNVQGEQGDNAYKETDLFSYLKGKGYDLNDQRVQDAISSGDFKDYSLLGNPVGNFMGVFTSSAKAIGDFTPLRDQADIQSEKIHDALFPTQVLPTDQFQLTKKAEIGQNIGNITGQVLGQGLMQYGTVGLGRVAGLSELAANRSAFWLSGAVTSYDQAYKDATDFIDSETGRVAYAGLIALSNSASEGIFPDIKFFQIPGVKDHIADLSKRIGTEGFTKELASEILGKAKNEIIQYGKKMAKNVGEETFEEVVTQNFEDGLRYISGDPNASFANAVENAKNTAYQTATGMLGLGLWGAHKDVQHEKNVAGKGTIYNAALYHDEAIDAINKGVDQGLYDNEERNKMISVLNTAKQATEITDKTEQLSNVKLSRGNKSLYVANLTAEALLTKQLKDINTEEGVVDVLLRKDVETKIANLQNQREQLLKGDVQIDDYGNISSPNTKQDENKDNGSGQASTDAKDAANAENGTNGQANANAKTNQGKPDGNQQGNQKVNDMGAVVDENAAPNPSEVSKSVGALADKVFHPIYELVPEEFKNPKKTAADEISDAYEKSKSDGSNPKLVKAVEDAIGVKEETPAAAVKPTRQKPQADINDEEYNNFIDKGKVTDERLSSIADKVKNQESLSDREKEIFTDKTAEVNKIISDSVKPTLEKPKRQRPKVDILPEATELVKPLLNKGALTGIDNSDDALKYIAQQAQNVGQEGEDLSATANAREATEKAFSPEIVKAAIKLHPRDTLLKEKPTVESVAKKSKQTFTSDEDAKKVLSQKLEDGNKEVVREDLVTEKQKPDKAKYVVRDLKETHSLLEAFIKCLTA